jgi:hypothetical protein
MSALSRCHCVFPQISYPGKCEKCQLSHEEAERMRIKATEIPFRFWSKGDISWRQQEKLAERIDVIVWETFRSLRSRETNLGELSVLCYFQESILRQVRNLMYERHHLLLEWQDENVFKTIDTEELIQSKLK